MSEGGRGAKDGRRQRNHTRPCREKPGVALTHRRLYTQTLSDTEASSENAPKGQILLRLVFLGCFNIKISYPSLGSHARMDTHPFTQRRFYTLRNFTAISSALEPQSVRKDGVEHLDMAVLLPFFGAHTSFHTKRFPSVPSR